MSDTTNKNDTTLVNYRLRSLLEAGGFRPLIHSLS